MFFSGDPKTRKRVNMGGRSSKEPSLQVVVEKTRLERKRRLSLRQQTAAAIKIQKFFRGRKIVEAERAMTRAKFISVYGDRCQNVDLRCFEPDSVFLREFLFFFNASNSNDVSMLVETCRDLLQFVQENGNVVNLFAGMDYYLKYSIVNIRVKKFAFSCLEAVHHNRSCFRDQLLNASECTDLPTVVLLKAVAFLIAPTLPWACEVINYLVQRDAFFMMRNMVLVGLPNLKPTEARWVCSSLEHVMLLLAAHAGQHLCDRSHRNPQWSFSFQLLSIPFFWHHMPYFKEQFFTLGLGQYYIHEMASCLPRDAVILPKDTSPQFPGHACLLGNLLEAVGTASTCSFVTALDFLAVSTFLLDTLPTMKSTPKEREMESEMPNNEECYIYLDKDLETQISKALNSCLLQNLVSALFDSSQFVGSSNDSSSSIREVDAVGAMCAFLHVTFSTLPLEYIMTGLAYRTEIVYVLWNFIKRCHENRSWPLFSKLISNMPSDADGWLLPLAVFSPVYKHMLMIIDNEEFYEQEKPLSLKDIRLLIVVLRQALWQLLWTGSSAMPVSEKSVSFEKKKLSVEVLRSRAGFVISELLSQLQDWNNRRPFTSATDFNVEEASNENFISQVLSGNAKVSEIVRQAPFLLPFTSRVKIYSSLLSSEKGRNGSIHVFASNHIKIRRGRILEDAFRQLISLSEEELRGRLQVSFVNEFGVEEPGVDGGGIFKDFMENITKLAFDVQHGLFTETVDHQLYPNPGSGLIHEQHLQFFHFLGNLLGKALHEGILVDVPFATFFLSKLKQKYNYLNHLPSLDPELYHHLLFLKHYQGDLSKLELYFVITNNEYGQQIEEELLPGGKDIRVTNENVITYIHLVANFRLNYQIRHQSLHFLRGFQQLIRKEWIDMFSENEIQALISGSLERMDIDDLRSNTNYSVGYNPNHPVIEMFWEVLESFSFDLQKKFLKFVTGCSRGPLLGFKYLEPKFCIQRAAHSSIQEEDLNRLPTASTCINLLKLPPYRSKEQLQSKLLYSINAEAGFDLS